MGVVIRLSRVGKKGERKFRVVVAEKRSRRDGRSVETLGYFEKGKGGKSKVDRGRYDYWLSKGARPSETVRQIFQK